MIRKPIVSGQFYPGNFEELDKEINNSFESTFGPAITPGKRTNKEIKAIISPHAGYLYSGPCAAWAYKEIAESKFADTYLMLGLSHGGYPTCLSLNDWETPFGIIKIDKKLGKELISKGIPHNEEAHEQEHSIEVQLPFLQFASRDKLNNLKILPIIISPDKNYLETAKIIADTIKDKNIVIITSSDFTHFGFNYGYFPFKENIKENLYELDKKAIEHIKKLDSKNFLHYTEKTQATICGKYPIATTIEITKLLGAKKGKLLHYYTSADIMGDYNSAVGYASLTIE